MANTRNERDHKLELFCLYVEHGKTPPPELQQFIAQGVRDFLSHGKPWSLGKGKRPSRGQKWSERRLALQIALLEKAGFRKHRIAEILKMIDGKGTGYEKKIERYGKLGHAVIDSPNSGEFEAKWAAESMTDDLRPGEKQEVRKILAHFDLDSEEPNYE